MKNLDRLAERIHAQAAKSGFWDTERNMGEMLMLAVSELSEALEEHRDGKPPVYFPVVEGRGSGTTALVNLLPGHDGVDYTGLKPEGTLVELADCKIRLLDTLWSQRERMLNGSIEETIVKCRDLFQDEPPENFAEGLAQVAHWILSGLGGSEGRLAYFLSVAIVLLEHMMVQLDEDPDAVIEVKMAYNATRGHKHGKAY